MKKLNKDKLVYACSHHILIAAFLFVLMTMLNTFVFSHSSYASHSVSMSRSGAVSVPGEGKAIVNSSPDGVIGVGKDTVSISTTCSADYNLYVTTTSTGSSNLVRSEASLPASEADIIPSTANNPLSPDTLAKDTWGIGKTETAFSAIQDYDLGSGSWTPLYTESGDKDLDIYYGVNISTDKNNGTYTGSVLYTTILTDACVHYKLDFDTSSATLVDTTVLAPQTISYDSEVDLATFSASNVISKTGYTLSGWKYNIDETEYTFSTTDNININPTDAFEITLVPIWAANTYNVIYDAGSTEGVCNAPGTSVTYDGDITLLGASCEKFGFTQDGWATYPAVDNVKAYDLNEVLVRPNFSSVDGDTYILYPHFVVDTNVLTIINSDPTAINTSPETGSVDYDTPVTVTCTSNTGYHCTGWTSDKEELVASTTEASFSFNMPDEDLTLTATSSANTYTVIYDAGNTSSTCDASGTSATYNANVTLAGNSCTKVGFTQDGWSTSPAIDNTKEYGLSEELETPNFTSVDGGVIVLYPHFVINSHMLTIMNSNSTAINTSPETGPVDYNTFIEIACSANTGYHCTGWTSDKEELVASTTDASSTFNMPDDDITLTATGVANTYTITYDPGDSESICNVSDTSATYDANVTLPGNSCEKFGFTQDGWSTSPDSTNTKDYDLAAELVNPNFTSVDGDTVVLYPHFTINSHTLTIINDNPTAINTSMETSSINYNTPVEITCTANTGYHCTGWISDKEELVKHGIQPTASFNMPDDDIALTFTGTANTYTIRYNANGGTGTTSSQTGESYASTTTLRDSGFSRVGHQFQGWAYSASAETPDFAGGQENVSVSTLAENNATGSVVNTNGGTIDLYAVWSVSNYTFTYDTNGAVGVPGSASSSGTYDDDIILPGQGTMEKTGYAFAGWALSSTATVATYSAITSYDISTIANDAGEQDNDANITLYAVWAVISYSLKTVNGNTSYINSISPNTGNSGTGVPYGALTTVSCVPNTGYHCTGWTSSNTDLLPDSANASYSFYMPAGNVTLTASADVNTYTIRYNANGGSGTVSSQTGQTYGSTVTLQANDFTRAGYTFQGWAYSSSATSADFNANQSNVSVATLATNNASGSVVGTNGGVIDLYAVWKGNPYTIYYAAGDTGGSCSISSTSATYGQSVNLSSSTCSKTGYHQDGWSTSSSSSNYANYSMGESVSNLTTSSSITLYPHFSANYYIIYYNSNGGSGSTSSQTVYYGDDVTLRSNNFSRSGYQFQHWSMSSSSSSPAYYAGSTYSVSSLASSAGVTNSNGSYIDLYAVWQGNSYTIYYAAGSTGGSCSVSSTSATYGQTVYLSSSRCTKTNYYQDGWSTSSSSSNTKTYNMGAGVSNLTTSSSITLYPHFYYDPPVSYYTLNVSGGIIGTSGSTTSSSYTSGSRVTVTANSPSSGYHFTSWSSSNGGSFASSTSTQTTFTMPSASTTVTANTTANNYTIVYNGNGGSGSTSSQTVYYGNTVTLRSNGFSKNGYTFLGWSMSSSATSASYAASSSYNVSSLTSSAGVTNSNGATINLYAVWKQTYVATVSFQTTGSCANITPGTTGALYDARDNQTYTVYRWPTTGTSGTDYPVNLAGYCIMTQDLALGNVTSGSITKDSDLALTTSDSYSSGTITARSSTSDWNTNDTSSTNLQYINGSNGSSYYSYYAAQKVCPKGWKTPNKSQYVNIVSTIGSNSAARSAPYNFNVSGYFTSSGWMNTSTMAEYWSGSTATSPNSYALYIHTSGAFTGEDTMPRNYGFTVRCVNSGPPYMQTANLNVINPGASSALKDTRDAQWYNVYRFPTSNYPTGWANKIIMTEDLRLGYVTGGSITAGSNLSLTTDDSAAKATITARTVGSTWSETDSDSNKQYVNGTGGTYGRATYYSFGAALAVCPKGWSLPTQPQYANLVSFAGGSNSTGARTLTSAPYNFNYSGRYLDKTDGFQFVGSTVDYWTSSSNSDNKNGYFLQIDISAVNASTTASTEKSVGYVVRCIATAQ